MTRPIVLSYGGGKNTIAILALVADGKLPKPDVAVFADTGRERTSTWRYLDQHARPLMDSLGIEFHVATHDLATVDLYATGDALLIPAFTETGKLPTFCSGEWKRRVMRRYLRSIGYGPQRPIVEWLGMCLDEIHRLHQSDVDWIDTTWPLVFDVPLRRIECETVITRVGLPMPSKSACWMCPHLNNDEWRDIRDNDPADFAAAIVLDEDIRQRDRRGGVYLHGARVPLAQADLDTEQPELPLFECAGSCWT